MVELFGSKLTRRDLAMRSGALSQFAGVRLMTLGDGLERGVRMLEFRTGTGLRFTVLIDRALDIADCEYCGMAIGWHSPAGFKHPGLLEYEGEGGLAWLRSFSGLLVTCGLDHILFMHEESADHYRYDPRSTINHSIHGRVSGIPARLAGYGEHWDGDECTLWCEGVVSQGAVFGENLQLVRRIEAKVGSNEIKIHDRVSNCGFYVTPHMYCYHINLGYPTVAEGTRYLAPITDVVWAAHAGAKYRSQNVGYHTMPAPQMSFHEQVWQHELACHKDGETSVAVINDALELGFELVTFKNQFPCMFQWQNMQAGLYALGVEPSTNHVLGHKAADERGELIRLEHGEERRYDATFRILAGKTDISACEARIGALAAQPSEDFPPVSGNHRPIAGRR
jgi:hypothetical protein